MPSRVQLTIDLGGDAPIEAIRELVDSIDTVCQFGGELGYRSAVAAAEWWVLSHPDYWESPYLTKRMYYPPKRPPRWPFEYPPLPLLGHEVSQALSESRDPGESLTKVERISYQNPFEIILCAGALTLLVLQFVRDWPERKRVGRAIASDFENTVSARKRIRDHLVTTILNGDTQLTAGQINELLSSDVTDAIAFLGDRQLNLRALPPPGTDSDADPS